MKKSRFKALALFSGGLDSILAVKIIQKQGIEVEGLVFQSSFFEQKSIHQISNKLKMKFHFIDINKDIIKIIENPKYGFGKNLNPCIDCHLLMIKKAGQLLKKYNADFIITGEVVGERPKSQNYKALSIIASESGFGSLLLRPLSAKKLPMTEVEKKGIVDRKLLYDITGKGRQKQIKLANEFNIQDYPQPAGGCLLTVPRFADRLRMNLKLKKISTGDIELLKYGRHFLTQNQIKIVIGRDKRDNDQLLSAIDKNYYIFELEDAQGPVGVLCQCEPEEDDVLKTASLVIRYSKLRDKKRVKVKYYRKHGKIHSVIANPKDSKKLNLTLI